VRKRANDREAQRSIRQRTKNHIEELERRIQDLSGEHDDKNIEELQRRNAELEQELRQLKEVLGRSDNNLGSSASSASSPDLTPLSCKPSPV
jgi:chromosome segregation ATPase